MALLMAMMFCVFILQIMTRYLAKYQLGGDFHLDTRPQSTCMVWMVFFGGAFVLVESDHVKFDMIYNLFGIANAAKRMSIITSLAIAGSVRLVTAGCVDLPRVPLQARQTQLDDAQIPSPAASRSRLHHLHIYLAFAVAIIWRYASALSA